MSIRKVRPNGSKTVARAMPKGRPKPTTFRPTTKVQEQRLGALETVPKRALLTIDNGNVTRLVLKGRPKPIAFKQTEDVNIMSQTTKMQVQGWRARLQPKGPRQGMRVDVIQHIQWGRPKPIPNLGVEITMESPITSTEMSDKITTMISQANVARRYGLKPKLRPWWPRPTMNDEATVDQTTMGWPKPSPKHRFKVKLLIIARAELNQQVQGQSFKADTEMQDQIAIPREGGQ
jgi:hypothetical protein